MLSNEKHLSVEEIIDLRWREEYHKRQNVIDFDSKRLQFFRFYRVCSYNYLMVHENVKGVCKDCVEKYSKMMNVNVFQVFVTFGIFVKIDHN